MVMHFRNAFPYGSLPVCCNKIAIQLRGEITAFYCSPLTPPLNAYDRLEHNAVLLRKVKFRRVRLLRQQFLLLTL